jgi:hypothetical protein
VGAGLVFEASGRGRGRGRAAAGNSLASLTVSVSYACGETWTETPVRNGMIHVANPQVSGTVSSRAEVEDRQGDTTVQTIVEPAGDAALGHRPVTNVISTS